MKMGTVEIGLLISLIIKLIPAIEQIISGQLNQKDIDWNDYLKKDDFLEKAEKIKNQKSWG